VPADRRYLPGTMVLETSWDCGEGWIIVRDCLVMGPWRHEHPERTTHVRPPTDYDAEHTLLRTVRCVQGSVQLAFDCEPVFGYGMRRARWSRPDSGYHQAVTSDDGAPGADAHLRHPVRAGRAKRPRKDPAPRRRYPVLRALVGPPHPAGELPGGLQPPGLDGAPLAALAGAG
jgi:hypothetical protein